MSYLPQFPLARRCDVCFDDAWLLTGAGVADPGANAADSAARRSFHYRHSASARRASEAASADIQ